MTDQIKTVQSDEHLKSFVARIERLEEDKANISHDLKEVYSEADGSGFNVKILRKIISMRKMEDHDRSEQEEVLELYKKALGMS